MNTELTPSEIVLLYAHEFVGKPNSKDLDRELALNSKGKVSFSELAIAMITAAVLACEHAGEVTLDMTEIDKQKSILHRLWGSSMKVIPTGKAANWPKGCLESLIEPKRPDTLDNIVARLLKWKINFPEYKIVRDATHALAARGLVAIETRSDKSDQIPHDHEYGVLTEEGCKLLEMQRPDDVLRMLAQCEQNRPSLWREMIRDISVGVNRMGNYLNASGIPALEPPYYSIADRQGISREQLAIEGEYSGTVKGKRKINKRYILAAAAVMLLATSLCALQALVSTVDPTSPIFIPTYPGVLSNLNQSGGFVFGIGERKISFETPDSASQVLAFYKDAMSKQGWEWSKDPKDTSKDKIVGWYIHEADFHGRGAPAGTVTSYDIEITAELNPEGRTSVHIYEHK